ncbi:flowering-promoting factor 1-like protein 3 [Tanacetum coccineum]
MSGVWVFKKNGVVKLVENPGAGSLQGASRGKVLVHLPTNEVVTSYEVLERMLTSIGWERYYDDPDLFQFHKRSTIHLISLPKSFKKLKSMHMYDIVVKNRNVFERRSEAYLELNDRKPVTIFAKAKETAEQRNGLDDTTRTEIQLEDCNLEYSLWGSF